MICLIVILTFGISIAQDADCDRIQKIGAHERYYINESYNAGRRCRYIGICPDGYNCRLNCLFSMPQSANCSGDHVLLSRSGDYMLTAAEVYCGRQTLTAVSSERTISLGLEVPESSPGGNIMCMMSSQLVPLVPPRSPACRCGERKKRRIVGGEEVKTNEYTMMAGIIENKSAKSIHCGGVIVASRHVMTAAHCLTPYQKNHHALSVFVGNHYIIKNIPVKERYKIFRFIIHENYNGDTFDFDIALVVLKRKIQFSESVLPVCLPFKYRDTDLTGETVTILGWGTTSISGPKSDALLKVDVQVISQKTCNDTEGVITDRHMCTFSRGKDACQYDSGGPLLLTDPTTGLLFSVGIVSNGNLCATRRPGINTRVTTFLRWLEQNTRDNFCEQ